MKSSSRTLCSILLFTIICQACAPTRRVLQPPAQNIITSMRYLIVKNALYERISLQNDTLVCRAMKRPPLSGSGPHVHIPASEAKSLGFDNTNMAHLVLNDSTVLPGRGDTLLVPVSAVTNILAREYDSEAATAMAVGSTVAIGAGVLVTVLVVATVVGLVAFFKVLGIIGSMGKTGL
ncbi:MAG: hypothetical protein M5R41_06160 [Bacteroidia bacterium]|nr:hypothetical protein [Bacteroidia bacterium]